MEHPGTPSWQQIQQIQMAAQAARAHVIPDPGPLRALHTFPSDLSAILDPLNASAWRKQARALHSARAAEGQDILWRLQDHMRKTVQRDSAKLQERAQVAQMAAMSALSHLTPLEQQARLQVFIQETVLRLQGDVEQVKRRARLELEHANLKQQRALDKKYTDWLWWLNLRFTAPGQNSHASAAGVNLSALVNLQPISTAQPPGDANLQSLQMLASSTAAYMQQATAQPTMAMPSLLPPATTGLPLATAQSLPTVSSAPLLAGLPVDGVRDEWRSITPGPSLAPEEGIPAASADGLSSDHMMQLMLALGLVDASSSQRL